MKGKPSRWSKWLLFLPGAITFGLGTWQIFRRQEKVTTLIKLILFSIIQYFQLHLVVYSINLVKVNCDLISDLGIEFMT